MKKTKYLSRHPKSHKKKHADRKCRVCGKDPFPNYFYCPSCHQKVAASAEITDGEVNPGFDLSCT